MRLVIIGCGYVGLVSGACLADVGHRVVCVDTDADRIDRLNNGIMPIFEPGLEAMVARNVAAGRLDFVSRMPVCGPKTDAVFIAVGTPPAVDGTGADLSHVFAAAAQIASAARERVLVVTKSTVPVGTGRQIERIICDMRPDLVVHVASNPEFLREGNALRDFMEPDRIVVGTDDNPARHVLKCIYAPIATKGTPILFTSRAAAEITKYAANAFLAMKIAFINEISDLCEAAGAEIGEIAAGIGLDRRIGRDFLRAGPGYGGSCFPKDTAALVATAGEFGVRLRLVESTIAVNDMRKEHMVRRVEAALGGSVAGKTIAMLGLTFKAGTDDVRASPAVALAGALLAAGAHVRAYDPAGMCHIGELPAELELAKNSYACAESADCIVLATDWREFALLDFNLLAEIVRGAVFIDLRNAIHPSKLRQAGFAAHGIGYPAIAPTPGIAAVEEAVAMPRRKIMTPAPLSPSTGLGDAAP